MHLVHHSSDPAETNSNYASWLSIWDTLFGARRPTSCPTRLGLEGFDGPERQSLAGVLARPFC
jgi:sterol desaturase/sphingolipid hydroxylase (fatty acid hydroxylase superfamily)